MFSLSFFVSNFICRWNSLHMKCLCCLWDLILIVSKVNTFLLIYHVGDITRRVVLLLKIQKMLIGLVKICKLYNKVSLITTWFQKRWFIFELDKHFNWHINYRASSFYPRIIHAKCDVNIECANDLSKNNIC